MISGGGGALPSFGPEYKAVVRYHYPKLCTDSLRRNISKSSPELFRFVINARSTFYHAICMPS